MKILVFILLATTLLAPVEGAACAYSMSGCLDCKADATDSCTQCDHGYKLEISYNRNYCVVCPRGKGKARDLVTQTTAGICDLDCTNDCSVCGPTSGDCLVCKEGYFLTYRTKTCTSCGQGWGNYDAYSSEIYGYDTACIIKCPAGCSNCRSSYECLSCNEGFKFSGSSRTCVPCDVGKGRALDTSIQTGSTTCEVECSTGCKWCGATPERCLGCNSGYSYSLETKTCTPCAFGTTNLSPTSISLSSTTCNIICDSKCAACEGTPTKCTRCAAGYLFVFATNTCTECPAGKGRAEDLIAPTADTVCDVSCQSPCTKCGESETSCLGCEAHFQLTFATKSCTTCPAGTTKAADTSVLFADSKCDIACAAGCSLCSGTATNCLGCQAGYKYNFASKSCSTCEVNKGRAQDVTQQLADTTCSVNCDSGCLFCGDLPATCLGCNLHYRLDWITKTCIACGQGFTKAADAVAQSGSTTCNIKCSSQCTFCSGSATKCQGCQAGFKYTASTFSCSSCPVNQGRAANLSPISTDTSCDQTCTGNCLFCGASPTECVGCQTSYRLSHYDKICILCSGGRGNTADTVARSQDSVCEVACVRGCDTCTNSGTNCIRCDQSYFMAASGSCERCAIGKGKPKDTTLPTPSTTSGNNECSPCHMSCTYCKGPLDTDCIGCRGAYYGDYDGKCSPCGDGSYGSDNTDYNKYELQEECNSSCHRSCQACTSSSSGYCTLCAQNYYWAGSGTCTICPPGTGKLADTAARTTASTSAECDITCHPTCVYCFGTAANQCLTCRAGLYLNQDTFTCDQRCSGGRGKEDHVGLESYGNCPLICSPGCDSCIGTAATQCLTCAAAYYMSAPYTCTACPRFKGSPVMLVTNPTALSTSDICFDCHFSCKSCYGPLKGNCLNCRDGFYWSGNGRCEMCGSTMGKPEDTQIMTNISPQQYPCSNCHQTCLVCSGYAADKCVTCSAARYKSALGTCEVCAPGTGKSSDVEPRLPSITNGLDECYIPCHSECVHCYGPENNKCLSCPAGRYLATGNFCTPCQLGLGKPADTTILESHTTSAAACTSVCHASCLTCSGSTASDCLLCNRGYFRSAPNTCSLCPLGRGKLAETSKELPSTDGGVTQCDISCHNTCGVCFDNTSSGCLNCRAGYYFTMPASCSNCGAQSGKLTDTTTFSTSQSSGTCNIACHVSCQSCTGTGATDCIRCKAGMYLKSDGTCAICSHGTGKVADLYPITPTVDGGATECSVTCDESCHTCVSALVNGCLNCGPTYWWAGSGRCTKCTSPTTKGGDLTIVTAASSQAACDLTCHPSCQVCDGNPNNCLFCNAGGFYSAPGTCTMCDRKRGKRADNMPVAVGSEAEHCISCHYTCDRCSGPNSNQCLSCAGGHYLQSPGVCTKCAFGKGTNQHSGWMWPTPVLDAGLAVCSVNCHPQCSSCYDSNSPTTCAGCAEGYYYSAVGTCTQCDLGFGKPTDTAALAGPMTSTQACTDTCHLSCLTCKGPGTNDCLRCAAGYYLSATNTCSLCRKGWGKLADDSVQAVSGDGGIAQCSIMCHETCGTCSGTANNKCLSCSAGFFWSGDGTCTQCDDRKGKLVDAEVKKTPQPKEVCNVDCHEGCLICSAANLQSCVKCSAGYFYSAPNTCEMCPLRKGKPADVNFPTVGTSAICDVDCNTSCRTCTAAGSSDCLNCIAGFYYSALGTCSPCEFSRGKPEDLSIQRVVQQSFACSQNCHSSCHKCKGSSATDCLSCNEGFYLSAPGTCSKCPTGFGSTRDPLIASVYPNPSTSGGVTECPAECHSTCVMCKDGTAAGCLSCQFAHFLSVAGTCSICPSGRGKPADTAVQTLIQIGTDCTNLCTEGCQNCILAAANSCVSCKAGYFRSDTNSCTICTLGTGGPGSPLLGTTVTEEVGCPATCHFSCKTCFGPGASNCIKCKAGYFLSAAGTCSICPFGTGKSDDTESPSVSTTAGDTECSIKCHATCRTCFDDQAGSCVNCRAGHFWESGVCTQCPAKKGKPADTTIPLTDQTEADCKDCHPTCKTCGSPAESDCASCVSGHWWSGKGYGVLGKCESCPKSRGKSEDIEPYFITSTSPETCTIFCDLCNSGCLTCSERSSGCVSCIQGKFLAANQKCLDCPENCQSCTGAEKCEICYPDFELTLDSKSCLKCQVKNCAECKSDPFKCTKCADKFTLKSANECVYEPKVQPLSLNLSYVSITENKELTLNLLENKLEFPFNSRESINFTSITMEDKLLGKFYSCEQLGCSYSIVDEKLKLRFDSQTTVQQGRLVIERGSGSRSKSSAIVSNKNGRQLQTQEAYRIVADGIALMKESWLTTAAKAVRIVVGVLRLPFSLLVFWKYPHLAMLMDHMVTHLKVYALISQPFMAYVEVIFQSVAESKILPFQFANPFEGWNANTLECEGFLGIRSKNMQCSFFDNYGQNIIGFSSILLLCVILTWVSKYMLNSTQMITSHRKFWEQIANNYGLPFLTSKFDANHIEMTLMILVAYCTADHSSKSVVGITLGTFGLLGLGLIAKLITMASISQYAKTSKDGSKNLSQSSRNSRLFSQMKSKSKLDQPKREETEIPLEKSNQSGGDSDSDELSEVVSFALNASSSPNNKWSVYFYAARYVRALLLAIFVTTVRDPVEQVVLVVVLESVYLVALILLDFRGSRGERLFYTVMHTLMLLHLILRAVATSKSLSDRDVQSSLAAAIVVVLMVYIFSHVIAALLVLAGIFKKTETFSPGLPNSSKIEIIQSEAVHSPSPGGKTATPTRDPVFVLPAGPQISSRGMEIPEEGREEPSQVDITPKNHYISRTSKIEHIHVRVEVSKPTAPGTLATPNDE